MTDCCSDKERAIEALKSRQSATLKIVLAINAVMFVVGLASGLLARSTALLSDSLDNLGDALTYGLSLYAVEHVFCVGMLPQRHCIQYRCLPRRRGRLADAIRLAGSSRRTGAGMPASTLRDQRDGERAA